MFKCYVLVIGLLFLCGCIWLPKSFAEDADDSGYGTGGYGTTGLEKASLPKLLAYTDLIVVGSVQERHPENSSLGWNTTPYNIVYLKIDEIIGTKWTAKELALHLEKNGKGEQYLYVLEESPGGDGCAVLGYETKYLIFLRLAKYVKEAGGSIKFDIKDDLKIKKYIRAEDKLIDLIIPKEHCFYVYGGVLGIFLLSDPEKLPVHKRLKEKYGEKYEPFSYDKRLFKDSFGLDLKEAPELVKATKTFCRILELDKEEEIKTKLTELTKHEKEIYSTTAKEILKRGVKNKFVKQEQEKNKR